MTANLKNKLVSGKIRLVIYFKKPPQKDRFIKGDRYLIDVVRRIVKGKPRKSGIEKVFLNLLKGFELLRIPYTTNLPFRDIKPTDMIIVLGVGRWCLKDYNLTNRIIAGIGLMTHPSEWPDLCEKYPVAKYLQHSEWASKIYEAYYKGKCVVWPVGIDTDKWQSKKKATSSNTILLYNKIHWNNSEREIDLISPIKKSLRSKGFSLIELRYGFYNSKNYYKCLGKVDAMIFLSEHESQGIAYQECLSMNIPIFAWDVGKLIDPNYKIWNDADHLVTSVPYFDERCGMKFKDFAQFNNLLPIFISKVANNEFSPRSYIMENLTLEKSAEKMLEIVNDVYFD